MGNLVFQATLGGQVNLVGPNTASTYNINVPTVNGNLVTTGDTGTVTNTMCATSVYTAPGTIGSGTPNTGAFTTLAASSTVTLSGGTANGVAYLNGSKVVTSGSALVFDGTNLGVGVTPSAWGTLKALEFAGGTSVASDGTAVQLTSNAYFNGTNWIYKNSAGAGNYYINNNTHNWRIASAGTAGNAITFTTAMTLDTSGNLGLGVTPSAWYSTYKGFDISGNAVFGLSNGGGMAGNSYLNNSSNWIYKTSDYATLYVNSLGQHRWYNAASGTAGNAISFNQAMTLDASGNLVLGDTAAPYSSKIARADNSNSAVQSFFARNTNAGSSASCGYYLNASGNSWSMTMGSSANNSNALVFSVDAVGTPVEKMRLDSSGNLDMTGGGIIGRSANSSGLYFGASCVLPASGTALSDNGKSMGNASWRWTVIYAVTGTINTSDATQKQDVQELTSAEQRVAVAIKGLMRTYRFKDAVAEKGDAARIHVGVMAQSVRDAFIAEGLDANRYAMFCSDTWVDEETNEEQTRLGIRYDELLAFVIAAI